MWTTDWRNEKNNSWLKVFTDWFIQKKTNYKYTFRCPIIEHTWLAILDFPPILVILLTLFPPEVLNCKIFYPSLLKLNYFKKQPVWRLSTSLAARLRVVSSQFDWLGQSLLNLVVEQNCLWKKQFRKVWIIKTEYWVFFL